MFFICYTLGILGYITVDSSWTVALCQSIEKITLVLSAGALQNFTHFSDWGTCVNFVFQTRIFNIPQSDDFLGTFVVGGSED